MVTKNPSDKIRDRANREWYEMMHSEMPKDYEPNPKNFHPERDLACLKDLGITQDDDSKILVCGCGGGDDTWLLTENLGCRYVWGIDWSQPAIDFFNSYFRDGHKLNGDSVPVRTAGHATRADLSEMPFTDESFDYLLALDVTEHLDRAVYLFFLSNCYRVLKHGGKIAVLPGVSKREEHVNLLPLPVIAKHMMNVGFHIEPLSVHNQSWIIGDKRRESVYKTEVIK